MDSTNHETVVIALVIAGYAAIISTVTLIWNIIRGLRDRGQFKIILRLEQRPKSSVFLHITITNIGKRPASLAKLLIKYKKESEPMIMILDPAMRLEEAESHTWVNGLEPTSIKWLDKTRSVYALDATGKRWKMNRAEFNQFLSEARSIIHGETV